MPARAITRTPPPSSRERLTVISLGISPPLLEAIEGIAADERRSRAQMINILLEAAVADHKKVGRKSARSAA
jgi:hypothetical protein